MVVAGVALLRDRVEGQLRGVRDRRRDLVGRIRADGREVRLRLVDRALARRVGLAERRRPDHCRASRPGPASLSALAERGEERGGHDQQESGAHEERPTSSTEHFLLPPRLLRTENGSAYPVWAKSKPPPGEPGSKQTSIGILASWDAHRPSSPSCAWRPPWRRLPPAAQRATLRLVDDTAPATLRGSGFQPREHVRVVVVAGTIRSVRKVVATRLGRFALRIRDDVNACSGFSATAVGQQGNPGDAQARARSVPGPPALADYRCDVTPGRILVGGRVRRRAPRTTSRRTCRRRARARASSAAAGGTCRT